MKLKLVAFLIFGLMLFAAFASKPAMATQSYTATYKKGDDIGVTVDGKPDEWKDVPQIDVTLESAVEGTSTTSAHLKAMFSDKDIAFLFIVDDDFDYEDVSKGGSHHGSGAVALLFVLEGGADAAFMGGASTDPNNRYRNDTSVGTVDIWHFELDWGENTKDTVGDMWADMPGNQREDKGTEPSQISGAWSFVPKSGTTKSNGTEGTWYFEMMRPLTTNDNEDVQFEKGQKYFMNMAYWDADFDGEHSGWADEDHRVLDETEDVIELSLSTGGGSAPGFEAFILLAAIVPVTIVYLKKRN